MTSDVSAWVSSGQCGSVMVNLASNFAEPSPGATGNHGKSSDVALQFSLDRRVPRAKSRM